MDAHAAQLRRQMDATRAAEDARQAEMGSSQKTENKAR